MSFLEEIDERPRRRSSRRPPPRGPGVDSQTLWVRRGIAIAVGILIVILLVVGIHSCQVSRRHSAFRNYNRDVGALLQESDQESGELFNLLRNPSGNAASPVDVTNNANGVRVQAEQLVDRARGVSHPGELNTAQRYLLETLELRRDGIANIATLLRSALGDQGRQQAVNSIAGQMRNFDASDVIYSQRFVPEFQLQLKKQGLLGEAQIPKSAFLPDIAWLDPTTVADRIARIRGGGTATGPVAPGLHGTSLGPVVVKPGGQTLSTTQAVAIPAGANTSFDVQVTNGGVNNETNVTVRVTISGAGNPINVEQRIASFPHGTTQTVNVPLAQTPPTGQPVRITVDVLPVPGEKKIDNNKGTFPAIFTK
jgi:type II secretory pathway pseudopilin PulG